MEYTKSVDDVKPYEIETENRGTYFYAIVGGLKVMPEWAKDYWREIIDECDEVGLEKILIEKNFPETFSTTALAVAGPEILKMLMLTDPVTVALPVCRLPGLFPEPCWSKLWLNCTFCPM